MAVADEAVTQAQFDPGTLHVFASSSGEGANCHALCDTLASATPVVSPTRFTNSVHNASSGAWHIAVASRAPSTSLWPSTAALVRADRGDHQRVPDRPAGVAGGERLALPGTLNTRAPAADHFGVALL